MYMFRNLYLTSHDTREAKARRMSKLVDLANCRCKGYILTYRVVKFMVKVRLMEKRVKRMVGRVMVEKVTIQKRSPGMNLAMSNNDRPRDANQEVEEG